MINLRLWGAVLLISSLMLIGISVALFMAQSLPTPPLLLASPNCPQPCWQSIRPGLTSRAVFAAQADQNYRYRVSASYKDDRLEGVVRDILLTMRGDILLGDVILEFGPPSHAKLGWVAGMPLTGQRSGRQIYVGAILYFGNGLVIVEVLRPDCVWRFSPTMIVRRVRYHAPSPVGTVIPIGTPFWDGFVSQPLAAGGVC